jgi:hypothetical protein
MEAMRAVLMGVLVQAAANVNNTYWDFINGVDTPTVRSCFNFWCCRVNLFHRDKELASMQCDLK